MDVVAASRSRAVGPEKSARARWVTLTVTGAAAFWSANFLVSLTPAAAAYRSDLSIRYLPMLVEAAVGGAVLAGAVAAILVRFGTRVPGGGPLRRALFLATCALAVLIVVVELPAKLAADVDEPGRLLLVATTINVIRVLALGLAVGLVARPRVKGPGRPRPAATKETTP